MYLLLAGLLGLAVLAAQPAGAQPIDMSSGGPVEVTAKGGFEWRDAEQMVIAEGSARAVRGNVTVLADRLIARFRKKAGGPATPAAASAPAIGTGTDTGGNEIYRLEAEGNVRVYTPTDEAQGDRAVYDIDQAVLVMTGRNLKLITPNQVLTARDSMEYWSQKRLAIGRGNAVVVTNDQRRLAADTLVAYLTEPSADKNAADKPPAGNPAPKPSAAPDDPLAASGKLQRMEAFGNVEVRTIADTVRGERAVYLPDTGIARVVGNVRITHGENQINGPAADVNMKTGIARIAAAPGGRVQGLIMPNDATGASKPGAAGTPPTSAPGPTAAPTGPAARP
jgi:lipopolysaccharide export system protein LptA